MSAEGVSLYFDGYMDEEKQKEPIMLSIYFDEGEELFTEQYKNRETDYLIPFIGNAKWEVDVDGDGKRDSVYAKKVNTDVWDGYDRGITGLKAAVNGLETELIEGFDGDAYLLKKSGKYYIYGGSGRCYGTLSNRPCPSGEKRRRVLVGGSCNKRLYLG